MLSKRAIKQLKWLENHDQWMTPSELKQKCKAFDDRAFSAIKEKKYVDSTMDCDSDSWVSFRINDAGKAYLEGSKLAKQSQTREWLSLCLSAIAVVISIIALLMQ